MIENPITLKVCGAGDEWTGGLDDLLAQRGDIPEHTARRIESLKVGETLVLDFEDTFTVERMPSRQFEILRKIDRPEPLRADCTFNGDKAHKAHCVLLDALARMERGLCAEDWETRMCLQDARDLLDEILEPKG